MKSTSVYTRPIKGSMSIRTLRAREAAGLRRKGMAVAKIAVAMGLSRSYVSSLLNDPDGSGDKKRKEGYRLPCPICGTLMSGSDGYSAGPRHCQACATQEQTDNRFWTKEQIIHALREFTARTGRIPTASDVMCRNGGAPSMTRRLSDKRVAEIASIPKDLPILPNPLVVAREFGSWSNGIRALGFEPNRGGGGTHRESAKKEDRMRQYVVLSEGSTDSSEWRLEEIVEALNGDQAIQKIAQQAGTYVAVPLQYWVTKKVAERMMFAVVE
jgi:hypothetical protein